MRGGFGGERQFVFAPAYSGKKYGELARCTRYLTVFAPACQFF